MADPLKVLEFILNEDLERIKGMLMGQARSLAIKGEDPIPLSLTFEVDYGAVLRGSASTCIVRQVLPSEGEADNKSTQDSPHWNKKWVEEEG